jgi:hypothetical protein
MLDEQQYECMVQCSISMYSQAMYACSIRLSSACTIAIVKCSGATLKALGQCSERQL